MTDDVPYCVEGCGRPATTSRPSGVTADGTPIVELVCGYCITNKLVIWRAAHSVPWWRRLVNRFQEAR